MMCVMVSEADSKSGTKYITNLSVFLYFFLGPYGRWGICGFHAVMIIMAILFIGSLLYLIKELTQKNALCSGRSIKKGKQTQIIVFYGIICGSPVECALPGKLYTGRHMDI